MKLDGQKCLVAYSGVLTLGVIAALLTGFTGSDGSPRFDTITVQRINIVEPDGTLRMVLSNTRHFPGIIIKGHEYPDFTDRKASDTAGALFFDAEGTESGGLTFGGRKDAEGNISRWGHLAFDGYDQDQMFAIDAIDYGSVKGSTIKTWDPPDWPIQDYLDLLTEIEGLPEPERQRRIAEFNADHPPGVARMTVGNVRFPDDRSQDQTLLQFNDARGKRRLGATVEGAAGAPAMRFYAADGTVIDELPD
ncbi:hypothetical protein QFW77_16160 [Luteimonas sp. RD2P54]|uniref:Uncharacterized protein n=1 Tax=Luteimonas endophytica TaxID=3042023 RepID=A0ABT6JCM3_9GAMM|nr:hypothetical protein [Luteimonas endophytica]MDH5824509.1 hypothetical protein [Luteimonas endophytica]